MTQTSVASDRSSNAYAIPKSYSKTAGAIFSASDSGAIWTKVAMSTSSSLVASVSGVATNDDCQYVFDKYVFTPNLDCLEGYTVLG